MLLHVGYVKTGSTFLQWNLFKPEHGYQPVLGYQAIRDRLIAPPQIVFRSSDLRPELSHGIAEAEEAGLEPVVSHERLSGNPISGGYDAVILRDRLHELFPDARVLMLVREQRSMAVSCYKQYVREGGVGRIGTYLSPPRAPKLPLFDPVFLEYDRLVGAYAELFGRDRLLVLPFERFAVDPLEVVNRIHAFCGRPRVDAFSTDRINPSPKAFATVIRARTNRYFFRDNVNPTAPFRSQDLAALIERYAWAPRALVHAVETRWARHVEQLYDGAFRESNRRLQAWVSDDLGALGYPM